MNSKQQANAETSAPNLFEDKFTGSALSDQWRVHSPITVKDGVVRFAPINFAQLVTRREDFSDFVMAVDVRLVQQTAGFIVRWNSPHEYYMVQVGLPNDPASDKVGWFHVFSPKHGEWNRDDLSGGRRPVENRWYRLRLKAKGFGLSLSLNNLNDDNTIGDALIDELKWQDPDKLFASGAIGFWQCPGLDQLGEQAEFRNLQVTPLEE